MKKKIILLLVFSLIIISGCSNTKFKREYEELNDKKTSYNKNENYRKVSIDKDNPYVYSSAKDVLKKINNKETFYVYFGSPYCPWCRSVIEESIKSSKDNGIKKIYYVNIWKGFHEEILRDTYELKDGEVVKTKGGSKEYYELLDKLDNVLDDYTIEDKEYGTIKVGEKRIFAPSFIYIEKGKAKKLTTGISDNQKSYNSSLSKELRKDEANKFNEFFNN